MSKKKSKEYLSKVESARKIRSVIVNNVATTTLALLIFVATGPILLFLSNKQDFFDRALSLSPFKVFYFSSVLALIIISWMISNSNFQFSGKQRFLLYGVVPSGVIYILVSSDWAVFLYSQPDRVRTYTSPVTFVLAILLTILILSKNRFIGFTSNAFAIFVLMYFASFLILNEYHPYNANSLNLSIVVHPIIQSAFGVGLQSELRAQYGMYGEILAPVISFANLIFDTEVTLTGITFILALIFFISYFSVYLFLRTHLHNRLLLGVSFIGFMYLSLFAVTTWPSELYYQYYPIRLLFPMTSLLVVIAVSRTKSIVLVASTFVYLTVGMFWNLDVGLFTLLAVLVFFYALYAVGKLPTANEKNRFKVLLLPPVIILITVLAFNFIHLLRFGRGISLELFFASQKLFLSGQIPPINGVWRFVFLIYVCTLSYSIISLRRKFDIVFQAQILFISLLGLGLFLYFINNPHPAVLSNTYWPSIVLLILYTDRILKSLQSLPVDRKARILISAGLLFPLSWISSAGFVNLKNSQILKDQVNVNDLFDPNSKSNRALWTLPGGEALTNQKISSVQYLTVANRNSNPAIEPVWVEKSNVLKSFFDSKKLSPKSVAVFSMWDYSIYLDLKTSTPFNAPNFYHTYLEREWSDIEANLRSPEGVEYVVVDDQYGLWRGESLAHPTQYINEIKSLLSKKFTLVEDRDVGFTWYLDRWMPNRLSIYVRSSNQ
jgi:hypothetical protein